MSNVYDDSTLAAIDAAINALADQCNTQLGVLHNAIAADDDAHKQLTNAHIDVTKADDALRKSWRLYITPNSGDKKVQSVMYDSLVDALANAQKKLLDAQDKNISAHDIRLAALQKYDQMTSDLADLRKLRDDMLRAKSNVAGSSIMTGDVGSSAKSSDKGKDVVDDVSDVDDIMVPVGLVISDGTGTQRAYWDVPDQANGGKITIVSSFDVVDGFVVADPIFWVHWASVRIDDTIAIVPNNCVQTANPQ